MIFLVLPNFFSLKVEGHDQSSITKKTHDGTSCPQSSDTKTFFEAVLEFFEEKGVKFSKVWKQVHLTSTEPDFLVPMFGYNIGYTLIGGAIRVLFIRLRCSRKKDF